MQWMTASGMTTCIAHSGPSRVCVQRLMKRSLQPDLVMESRVVSGEDVKAADACKNGKASLLCLCLHKMHIILVQLSVWLAALHHCKDSKMRRKEVQPKNVLTVVEA